MVDPSTLAGLWRQYADRLLVIARACGEPAEDAVQEAFVALAQQTCMPEDPLAWLVTTTRNQLLAWHRGRVRRTQRERCLGASKSWFVTSHDAAEAAFDAEKVTQQLCALPREQREAITMHLWGGMTFRQIAAITGDSPATAHRQYQRGLESLRKKTITAPDGVSL